MTIEERVAQGAAWLDAHGPQHWWRAIYPSRLDVLSPSRCVLGMVYGYYISAPLLDGLTMAGAEQRLRLQEWLSRATEYGFRVTVNGVGLDWDEGKQEAAQLRDAWIAVIDARI